ncbi:periplasmic binding protein [Ectopseudomonas oleovorans]|uniref:Periplasmic binding protein n=1 Tax=Ectopseudomonas oleovorans TaxID=301 RepID=A0A379K8V4_ECTOL|nr:hypothetical protein [Pseudomonas oleovorans]SUD61165.1 periplasmic binding protein [Pseudomonas oleovorans]
MRLANILGGLAAVLLFPNLALAEPLPQRWVSSGGALRVCEDFREMLLV